MALTELINQYSVSDLNTQLKTQSDGLDKTAFLNLLVTQLKYQDPLDPVKNEDFIAQLAQFNSLEQMMNLNQSFEKTLQIQQLSQATNLIGQPVAYYNSEEELMSGIATSVSVMDGVPALQVGSDYVELDQIVALGQATSSSVLAQASYLIGMQVTWFAEDGTTEETGVVKAVELQNGGVPVLLIEDSDKQLGLSDIIAVSKAS